MFIAGKKGLKQDGTERLLMTGYGGFDVAELPESNPAWAWWMEQGGWFAVPDLRGGDVYWKRGCIKDGFTKNNTRKCTFIYST